MANSNYRHLFLLEEEITYLNSASMSPMLVAAKVAGLEGLETRATPWKITAADWLAKTEILRELVSRVFQTHPDNIALIPSASYGLAAAAKNLRPGKGKEILVLAQQFPSNYYVWEDLARKQQLELVTVERSNKKSLTESILEKISGNTGIVAIPNCHWIDGTWIDLQQISDAVKTVGTYLVLDVTQSLGVLPTDITRIQPDFAVAAGYKWMMSPYSMGYMYVAPQHQDTGDPLEYSWITRANNGDYTQLTNYTDSYRTGARKFDMGEFPQHIQLPIAIAGIKQLLDWKVDFIQSELKKLTDIINDYKMQRGLLHASNIQAGHICSIPLDGTDINSFKARLQRENIVVGFRGTSARISPHLHNDQNDMFKVLDCIRASIS